MTERALTQMLRRAAAVENPPPGLGIDVMSRVQADGGRARRWRVFVQLMVCVALLAGVVMAVGIGWALALKDDTHERLPPPKMGLFREEGRP